MTRTDAFEKVEITSSEDLRDWLSAHCAQPNSVWLVTWKKSANDRYVSREDVLDELIAFGWIDGIRRKLDGERTMQLISPRKQQAWAKSYKDRAARLEAEGRMHDAGRKAIERAKSAGLWNAMADVDALVVPPDLAAKLDRNDTANQYFSSCPPGYRRNVLRWLKTAKTDTTRNKRITTIVDTSARAARIPQL